MSLRLAARCVLAALLSLVARPAPCEPVTLVFSGTRLDDLVKRCRGVPLESKPLAALLGRRGAADVVVVEIAPGRVRVLAVPPGAVPPRAGLVATLTPDSPDGRAVLAAVAPDVPCVAPVPPPPDRLTPDLLCGDWRYDYGPGRLTGTAAFARDGTYEIRVGDTRWIGQWTLTRPDEIRVDEWAVRHSGDGEVAGELTGPASWVYGRADLRESRRGVVRLTCYSGHSPLGPGVSVILTRLR